MKAQVCIWGTLRSWACRTSRQETAGAFPHRVCVPVTVWGCRGCGVSGAARGGGVGCRRWRGGGRGGGCGCVGGWGGEREGKRERERERKREGRGRENERV